MVVPTGLTEGDSLIPSLCYDNQTYVQRGNVSNTAVLCESWKFPCSWEHGHVPCSCLYVGKQGGICCEGESTETDGHWTMKGEWNENIYSKSWQNLLIIDIKICVLDVLPCCCITIGFFVFWFFFLVIFSYIYWLWKITHTCIVRKRVLGAGWISALVRC